MAVAVHATAADLVAVTDVHVDAFAADPVQQWLFAPAADPEAGYSDNEEKEKLAHRGGPLILEGDVARQRERIALCYRFVTSPGGEAEDRKGRSEFSCSLRWPAH